jgi:hypothetical protein
LCTLPKPSTNRGGKKIKLKKKNKKKLRNTPRLPRRQEKGENQLEKKLLEFFHQTSGCHVVEEGGKLVKIFEKINHESVPLSGFNGFKWAIMAS